MDTLWNWITVLSRWFVWVGGAMLVLAAILVSVEVVLRKLFGIPLSSDEISSYLFAMGTSLSLSYALVTRGHIRIDALYAHLPTWLRPLLDILAMICLAIVAYTLVDRGLDLVLSNIDEGVRANTPLRTLLAYPQIPWLLGFGLFFVAIAVAILRSALALVRGDLATVAMTAGVASQDEEILSELSGLGIEMHKTPKS